MTCGPWRPINLEVFVSRIADLYCTTDVDKSLKTADVVAKAEVEGSANEVKLEISFQGKTVSIETVKVENGVAIATFKTQEPKLWYPVGYGEQPLYKITATLQAGGNKIDAT